jgi:hypothetical protein
MLIVYFIAARNFPDELYLARSSIVLTGGTRCAPRRPRPLPRVPDRPRPPAERFCIRRRRTYTLLTVSSHVAPAILFYTFIISFRALDSPELRFTKVSEC